MNLIELLLFIVWISIGIYGCYFGWANYGIGGAFLGILIGCAVRIVVSCLIFGLIVLIENILIRFENKK